MVCNMMSVRRSILQRITSRVPHSGRETQWSQFSTRLDIFFEDLFEYLNILYGDADDFLYFLEDVIGDMWDAYLERSEPLVKRDLEHSSETHWFMSNQMVGGVCYVDLFAGDLRQLMRRLDYIEELGINYLHLMPMFRVPEDENDGGYAVSSYRDLECSIGTMDDLRLLAEELHARGIVLVADFILNHTSDQHIWARKAAEGDPHYRDFYFIFPDRSEPDQYQRYLRDVFPEVRTGSFTYHSEMDSWIWTTFNSYQWDLNYHNHEVFRAMAREMMFLANTGIDVFRFDAIAFTWKEKGTRCESLPGAHTLVRAFRAVARIVAPSVVFMSEAILHPSEVVSYVDPDECELSYNPLLMAVSWEALATRDPRLLSESVSARYRLHSGCSWVNYVRCHDDIGWTFDDEDARSLGIDPHGHRAFLNSFYTGRFPGSFARGLPFQENSETGDCRVSGTCASLAGLEKGVESQDETEIRFAIYKIQLLYGLAFFLGGIPLIYLGDELGFCNDYDFAHDPKKAKDSRWVHRILFDWSAAGKRLVPGTIEYQIFSMIRNLVQIRKERSVFSMGQLTVRNPHDRHVFVCDRWGSDDRITILANFSDTSSTIDDRDGVLVPGRLYRDLIGKQKLQDSYMMHPWQFMLIEEYTREE